MSMWLKMMGIHHGLEAKLARLLDDRYLSSEDSDFIDNVQLDLDEFVSTGYTADRVLLFPPVNNYLRLLIHKTVEDYTDLYSFSVGEAAARRTVVCWQKTLISDSGTTMSVYRPPMGRGRGRARYRDTNSPGPEPPGLYKDGHNSSDRWGHNRFDGSVNTDRPRDGTDTNSPVHSNRRKENEAFNTPKSKLEETSTPNSQQKPIRTERTRGRGKRPDMQVYVPRGRRSQDAAKSSVDESSSRSPSNTAASSSKLSCRAQTSESTSQSALRQDPQEYPKQNHSSASSHTNSETDKHLTNHKKMKVLDRRKDKGTENKDNVQDLKQTDNVSDSFIDSGATHSGITDKTLLTHHQSKLSKEKENKRTDIQSESKGNVDPSEEEPSVRNLPSLDSGASFKSNNHHCEISELKDKQHLSDESENIQDELTDVSENVVDEILIDCSDSTINLSENKSAILNMCNVSDSECFNRTEMMESPSSNDKALSDDIYTASTSSSGNVLCLSNSPIDIVPSAINDMLSTSSINIESTALHDKVLSTTNHVLSTPSDEIVLSPSILPDGQKKISNFNTKQEEEDIAPSPVLSDNYDVLTHEQRDLNKMDISDSCEEDSETSTQTGVISNDMENDSEQSNTVKDSNDNGESAMCELGQLNVPPMDDEVITDPLDDVSTVSDNVNLTETVLENVDTESETIDLPVTNDCAKANSSDEAVKTDDKTDEVVCTIKVNVDDDEQLTVTGQINDPVENKMEADSDDFDVKKVDVKESISEDDITETDSTESKAPATGQSVKGDEVTTTADVVKEDDDDEDTWDSMFNEDGDCLDPSAMEELTQIVGKVKIQKSKKINYLDYKPKDKADQDYSEYGHIIEIYDFPAEFVTRDLITAFHSFLSRGFDLKWVDDTHALGIFSSSIAAQDAASLFHPLIKVRPLSQASQQSRTKAKRCSEFLQPYKPRPETSASAARRLVAGALGLATNVSREKRDRERQQLKEAKEKRKKDRRNREDIWEYGKCAMDEET